MRLQLHKVFTLIPALLLLASCQTHMTRTVASRVPANALNDTLSTNWVAAAKAALPARYLAKGDLSFQEITNSLCCESRRGNNAAKGLWGIVVLVQSRSPEESKAGLQLLRDSANSGYVPAIMNLGLLFEGEKYAPKDYNEAFHWFSLAAEKGIAEAQLQLGGCYHYGLGTTQDFSMAAKYYRLSAGQTNFAAMKSLGYLLMNGYGVEKNEDEAKYLVHAGSKRRG